MVQIPDPPPHSPGVPIGEQILGVQMFLEEKPPKDINRITTIDARVKGAFFAKCHYHPPISPCGS